MLDIYEGFQWYIDPKIIRKKTSKGFEIKKWDLLSEIGVVFQHPEKLYATQQTIPCCIVFVKELFPNLYWKFTA